MLIKPKSIKTNYLLNIIRLVLNTAILLLTMPYISRVLGSKGIGEVEYLYTVIEYFIVFSALGIPVYGIRQIAKSRDDIEERSRIAIELFIILLITTVLSYLLIFIFGGIVFPNVDSQKLLLFLSISIFLSNFGFEWFYQGIENQKYITVRHFFVKVVSVVLLFTFVKSAEDVYYYALFIILSNFGGAIFNFFYLKNFIVVTKNTFKSLNIKRHLKPCFTIVLASASVSVYMQLDKLMLGSMVSEEAVGYYAQAIKLPRMMITLIVTIGTVMLPRLSNLLHNKQEEEYHMYMNKTLKYILFAAVPAAVLFVLLSHDIILIMAGPEFLPSVAPMQLASPLLVIVGIAYYIGFLVLYPKGREKYYTIAVTVAGIVNFTFNYFVIRQLAQTGVALGTLLAEITGLSIMIWFSSKDLKKNGFYKSDNLKYFAAAAIIVLVNYLVSFLGLSPIYNILTVGFLGWVAYCIILYLMREFIITEIKSIAQSYLEK